MKVFFNSILVHTLLNAYVFWWGWKVIPPKKVYRGSFILAFVAELLIYLIGFIFRDHLPSEVFHKITIIGTSWMVLILYMTALLLLYDSLRYLSKKVKILGKFMSLRFIRSRKTYYFASIIFILAVMLHGNYKFWHPTVTELNLTIHKDTPNLKNLRVVMVADVHAGYIINRKVLKMYVDRIMEQKPDIILLVGDIIDHDLPSLQKEHMEEEFRRLKAPYGVYASTGNHEYRLNAEEKIAWLSNEAGLTVLRDSTVKIANSFYLIGREDIMAPKRENLAYVIKKSQVDKSLPLIVMNHEPIGIEEESDNGADLALYGHTHNGQLFPNNFVVAVMYEIAHGYKKKDNTHVYVTSGLGLSGPQYRIGTISEIVVLNLKFEK